MPLICQRQDGRCLRPLQFKDSSGDRMRIIIKLRKKHETSDTPVIMLTVKGKEYIITIGSHL